MQGGVTVTVKVQVAFGLFGLASDAVQVTVVVPTTKLLPEGGTQETDAPGQLSDAVGGVYVTTVGPLPLVEMFAGQAPIVGACVSCTVIVKEQLAPTPPFGASPLPLGANVPPSVQVTVVVPTG